MNSFLKMGNEYFEYQSITNEWVGIGSRSKETHCFHSVFTLIFYKSSLGMLTRTNCKEFVILYFNVF
jgi:hypothetical protein